MRVWILKLTGLLLWGMFLFAPFIARADEGFDVYLPLGSTVSEQKQENIRWMWQGYRLGFGNAESDRSVHGANQWSLHFNAGRDSVLTHSWSAKIEHDRTPLNDGYRTSVKFGVGLRYDF